MSDPLQLLATDEFQARCREVRRELDQGADLEPAEIAARLGIPLNVLMCAAAAWLASETGQPVVFLPPGNGGPTH